MATSDPGTKKPVRIAFSHKGFISFNEKWLEQFFKQNEGILLSQPLAILSIIGDPKSGRSFLLNMFLQYLKSKSDGGWMGEFMKNGWLKGFPVSWDKKTKEGLEPGIYMWPELLPCIDENDSNIRRGSILLLDLVMSRDEAESGDNYLLEYLCCFWSSMMVDNRNNHFKPDFLQMLVHLESVLRRNNNQIQLSLKGSAVPQLCDRFTFIVRDVDGVGRSCKAEEYAQGMISKESPHLDYRFKALMNHDKTSIFLIKTPDPISMDRSSSKLLMDSSFAMQMKSLTSKVFHPLDMEWKDVHRREGRHVLLFFMRSLEIIQYSNKLVNSNSVPRPLPDEDVNMPDSSNAVVPSAVVIEKDYQANPYDTSNAGKVGKDGNPVPIPHPASKFSDSSNAASPLKQEKVTEQECVQTFGDERNNFGKSMGGGSLLSQPQPQSSSVGTSGNKLYPTLPKSEMGTAPNNNAYQHPLCSSSKPVPEVHEQSVGTTGVHQGYQQSFASLVLTTKTASKPTDCPSNASGDAGKWQEVKQQLDKEVPEIVVSLTRSHTAALNELPSCLIEDAHTNQVPGVIKTFEDWFRKFVSSFKGSENISNGLKKKYMEDCVDMLKKRLDMKKKKAFVARKAIEKGEASSSKKGDTIKTTDGKPVPVKAVGTKDERAPQHSAIDIDMEKKEEEVLRSQNREEEAKANSAIEEHLTLQYKKAMEDHFTKLFRDHLFLNVEGCMREAHEKSVKAVWKNRWNFLNPSKHSQPLVLKDEETLGKFLVSTSIPSEWCDWAVKQTNGRSQTLEDMKTRYQTDEVEKTLKHLVEKMSDIHIRDAEKMNVTETLTQNLRSFCNDYYAKHGYKAIDQSLKTFLLEAMKKENFFQSILENFKLIQTKISQFREEIEKTFKMHRCLSPEKFDQLVERNMRKYTIVENCAGLHEKFFHLLDTALTRLCNQYRKGNLAVLQQEQNIVNQLFPNVETHYAELMADFTRGKYLAAERLKLIHEAVIELTLEEFNKCCNLSANEELESTVLTEFAARLNKHFPQFQQNNATGGERAMTHARDIVRQHTTSYNTKMDEFLPRKGPSRDDKELEKKHQELAREACKTVRTSIDNWEVVIDPDQYEASLKQQIEQDWIQVKKHNEKIKMEENRKKDADGNEKKTKSVEEKHKKINQVQGTRDKPSSSFSSTLSNKMEQNVPKEMMEVEVMELHPIAVEFGCNSIRVGWINPQTQKCEIRDIMPIIQITNKGEVFMEEEVDGSKGNNINVWDIFQEINGKPALTLNLDGKMQPLRPEVVFALFLTRIKKDIEETLNGRWTSVIMTVPLCFTSNQRRAIKDSTVLAGFPHCLLLNETSAAALYLANIKPYIETSLYSGRCVVVGISGKGYYDYALYKYGDGGIEMMGSCGNRHSSVLISSWGITRLFFGDDPKPFQKIMKELISKNEKDINAAINIYQVPAANLSFLKGQGKLMELQESKLSVVFGAAIFANTVATRGEEFAKSCIQDKISYMFTRDGVRKGYRSKLFEGGYAVLNKPSGLEGETTLGFPGQSGKSWEVREESGDFEENYVGVLTIIHSVSETKMKYSRSWDGIFELKMVYIPYSHTEVNYTWTTHNLTPSEILELRQLVQSLEKDEKKEALKKGKQDLQELVDQVKDAIPKATELGLIGKRMLDKGVDEAEVMIDHPKTTVEMLTGKLEYLKGLRNKYLN